MKEFLLLPVFAFLTSVVVSAFDQAPRALTTVMPVAPVELAGSDGQVDLLVNINAHVQPFRYTQGLVSIDPAAAFDKLPVAMDRVQPSLPEALRDAAGSVLVEFAIDAGGKVTSVAAKNTTLPELVEPTLAAARQWKFRAALKGGQPAAARVSIAFVFGVEPVSGRSGLSREFIMSAGGRPLLPPPLRAGDPFHGKTA